MALVEEYIEFEKGINLEKYNKQKVVVMCHVSYGHVIGSLGYYTKEVILCDIKIKADEYTYSFPKCKYKFYDANCFDKFVGCDIEFVATMNIEEGENGYYVSLFRPSKILKNSSNINNVEVAYFTRHQETFIYDKNNKELPEHFYKLVEEMDTYKVGHGKYILMTLENAYEQNYGKIKCR